MGKAVWTMFWSKKAIFLDKIPLCMHGGFWHAAALPVASKKNLPAALSELRIMCRLIRRGDESFVDYEQLSHSHGQKNYLPPTGEVLVLCRPASVVALQPTSLHDD